MTEVEPLVAFAVRASEMGARVSVTLEDWRLLSREVTHYPGLNAPALACNQVMHKFDGLAADRLMPEDRRVVGDAIRNLD